MKTLQGQLNSMFAKPLRASRRPSPYLAVRGDEKVGIRNRDGVWRCTLPSGEVSSVLLREVAYELRQLGYHLKVESA